MNHSVTTDVLASKGIRFANFIIDYIAILVFGGLVGAILGILSEITGSYGIIEMLDNVLIEYAFGYLIWLSYYIPFETLTKGRTLGKYITKCKVVRYDGSEPEFKEVLIRSLCRLIPFEQFSFLGEDGKGWHDSISKTYVVNIEKYEAKIQTAEGIEEIGRIGDHI